MRRRFGRGRRSENGGEGRAAAIDAAHWMRRIVEVGALDVEGLEPVALEGVPAHFAALGVGSRAGGRPVAVGFAPERASDGALAVLALGARRQASGEPEAALYAIAPDWSGADRRRLGLLAPRLPLEAIAVGALAGGAVRVAPEGPEPFAGAPELLERGLERADRDTWRRALTALEGLAAKHGGALRAAGDRAELVVLARRAAALVAEPGAVRIEVFEPERLSLPLGGGEGLATALDRLEGLLRKLLNDRRIRTSEPGLRAALAPALERAAELVASTRWPVGGAAGEAIDWVGLDAAGRGVVGAARETLRLTSLAEILDGAIAAAPALGELAARAGGGLAVARAPRLVLAAAEFEAAALDACSALGVELALFAARARRDGEWGLEPRPHRPVAGEVGPAPARRAAEVAEPPVAARVAAPAPPRVAAAPPAPRPEDVTVRAPAPPRAEAPRFEEVSLFDLEDEVAGADATGEGEASRRGRGRGRRRGRRGRGGERGRSDEGTGAAGRRAPAREEIAGPAEEADDDDEPLLEAEDEDVLAPLAEDVPELEEALPGAAAGYEDAEDEEDEADEDPEVERARRAREQRRRERVAKPVEPPPAPRRRAAILAHADPVSVLTAAVLARDVRLVESFWVYPQDDLMTFFRSIATDLRDQTPIFLVGFAASSPFRDTLQAASLYRGRLDWFDHHEWPPEDLGALREALGGEHVHVSPGSESSLAAVIRGRTRRSRFSDKLVELVTGRFSQHDYERWGRWWWHRAQEIASRPGDRRSDIEPLLAGRPSDLAREAARRPEPPLPPELAYVAGRDFRLVHFAGFTMVVLEVPPELDLHLCSRIARERYEAHLSLATVPGRELAVLGGDDTRAKRGLDLGSMAEHLAAKHAWVEALPDDDHVARMRVRGLHDAPDRFDELITEIAMGRSIVEG